jgi:predicted RNA-binding Zn-ribbon protein involved in translation (DUF1610 family)
MTDKDVDTKARRVPWDEWVKTGNERFGSNTWLFVCPKCGDCVIGKPESVLSDCPRCGVMAGRAAWDLPVFVMGPSEGSTIHGSFDLAPDNKFDVRGFDAFDIITPGNERLVEQVEAGETPNTDVNSLIWAAWVVVLRARIRELGGDPDEASVVPVVYLASWDEEGHRGPGRKFAIDRQTGDELRGDGRVIEFTPQKNLLDEARSGKLARTEFRARYTVSTGYFYSGEGLTPGRLTAQRWDGTFDRLRDGDTLCAGGSTAETKIGHAYRDAAALILADAGWRVVLDGGYVSRQEAVKAVTNWREGTR